MQGLLFAPRAGLHFEPVSTWAPVMRRAIAAHYTGSGGPPPGKKQAWRILEDGRDIGVIGLGEPAFKLSPRRRLGLDDALPLGCTVCCFIFRVDGHRAPAGKVLRAWHAVAEERWRSRYGWTPVHWETLVGADGEGGRVHHGGALGACFRRAGYRVLGWTTGRSARRPAGSCHGPRVWEDGAPKLVLYRGPLARVQR